ncbi:hypothetical protein [Methylomonas rapida]|uniref:MxaK protein n=1 Tax=Methylomonas rapida TaxID=2963939 RepID=A0ABY7GI53_9GAMM|nr:hypothetical protein [Methylomonas rapida]WAR44116.1 MxaK protein [Methylomonas rapida]
MRTLRHQTIWAVFLASLLLAVLQLTAVYRIHSQNQWLAELRAGQDVAIDKVMTAAPELRLARAIVLKQKQRYDEALETLGLIVDQGGNTLQVQSRYNLGNLYLTLAMAEVDAGRINQAMPLLTLAKQAYRQALKLDSGFWDAKYNLELAMKLLPEFDRISPNEPDDDAAKPSQLWTTVPGFPRGLP